MKDSTKTILTKQPFYFLFALLLSTSLVSCKKETADSALSTLRVVNASPSSATYNVYLNSSLLNSAALPLGGSTTYLQKEVGAYTLKFTTASTLDGLLTKTITLNDGLYQSFYLINKPSELDGLYATDDLSLPDETKSYIRFINLSPDAPAYDLAKADATTSLIKNKTYKSVSGFIAIDPGSYAFDAKETSTGAIKASLSSTVFIAGYHYDIICGGLVSPANDNERALTLQSIMIH